MVENLQDQFYQLEKKQAKGAKFCATRCELEGEKCSKTFLKLFERQESAKSNNI